MFPLQTKQRGEGTMLQFGILIYFADYRHASQQHHATLILGPPPPHKLTLPDRSAAAALFIACANTITFCAFQRRQKWIFMMMECRTGGRHAAAASWKKHTLERSCDAQEP